MGRKGRNIYLKTNSYALYSGYRHLYIEIRNMAHVLSFERVLYSLRNFLRFKSDVLQRLHYNSHHIIFSKTFLLPCKRLIMEQ